MMIQDVIKSFHSEASEKHIFCLTNLIFFRVAEEGGVLVMFNKCFNSHLNSYIDNKPEDIKTEDIYCLFEHDVEGGINNFEVWMND